LQNHLDRWIISKLQSLVLGVTQAYAEYEPTRAARAIQEFVNDHLSNWYVRLNRKRFWKGEMSADKQAAYETLHECLLVSAQLMSPIAPFYSEWLYKQLTDNIREKGEADSTNLRHVSVHLTDLTTADDSRIDPALEQAMDYAQRICSLVHSIRKNHKIKVRTPLQKILLPVLNPSFAEKVRMVEDIILAEVNVKRIEYIDDASGVLVKKVKPNFPKLGKQYGPKLKEVAGVIAALTQPEIATLEKGDPLQKGEFRLELDDVLISSEDIPGWAVATEGVMTVALDITITEALRKEGIARDFVNRIQNLRKEMGMEVLDRIQIEVAQDSDAVNAALSEYAEYIQNETQALGLQLKPSIEEGVSVDMDEYVLNVRINVKK
jgi:isoleucyl-tRNA synthetase